MIYLDYAANTPVDPEVMQYFCKETNLYMANPNSSHLLGRQSKARMEEITAHIAELIGAQPKEIIYTSGASEANNLAIKGLVHAYRENGKHIISTCLEHSSVSGALTYLQTQGYEIDLVEITPEGIIDLEHFKELLRRDTVLVTICYVDSELGVRQPIEEIRRMLKDYPSCYFHTDATQAVGKIPVDMSLADCVTFAPHKFFGLNGSGVLIKSETIVLEPLHHGGASTTIYRSGTPVLGQAAAIEKALELSLTQLQERYDKVDELNRKLRKALTSYQRVRINSSRHSIPHILNISVQGVKAGLFQEALEQEGICISIKSACSVVNTPSRPVYAVTRDKKNAMCSWRISISHLTTKRELEQFLEAFKRCYNRLTSE